MHERKQKPVSNGHNLTYVVEIVAAFVGHNAMPSAELPSFIATVHRALRQVVAGPSQLAEQPAPAKAPAVLVRKSVTEDFIICLEDGRKFKSLKRHLATSHGLTPEQYREKWSLPGDYPMVAPSYAAVRSGVAKTSGLGAKRKAAAARKAAAKSGVASQAV